MVKRNLLLALALLSSAACSSPSPATACLEGSVNCDGTCVNLNTDGANCGACNNACAAGQVCSGGGCAATCGAPLIQCGGGCVDPNSNPSYCGSCSGACGPFEACFAGSCRTVIYGTGTAADPYRTRIAPGNCGAYFPLAIEDGVYTVTGTAGEFDVYCDMTHGGVTYEDFGFGQHNVAYTGWTLVGGADFAGSTQFDEAFSYLYNRNLGLTNLQVGFTSNNCCIMNSTLTNRYGLAGSQYMYPAVSGSTVDSCNPSGGYTAARYQLWLPTISGVKASFTAAEAGTVAYTTLCSGTQYPAVFVKRY